jgi:hypothetical protein
VIDRWMRGDGAWSTKRCRNRKSSTSMEIVAPAASGEAEKPPCYVERMKTAVFRPEVLSDDALLARVEELVGRGRRVEAELVWHLAEMDARKLYLREACSSMHVYATSRLHLSDAEAYLRITVARVSRRFPLVLRMLADGRLHLSAIARLSPHLRDENCEALLGRAVHCSRREIELLVAEIAPKPDVASSMRRLPASSRRAGRGQTVAAEGGELRPDGVPVDASALRSPLECSEPAVATPSGPSNGSIAALSVSARSAEGSPLGRRSRPSQWRVTRSSSRPARSSTTRSAARGRCCVIRSRMATSLASWTGR